MWSDFESESVAGRYPLGKLVRSEGRYGWFETKFKEKPAIISLIESLNDEDVLLERLKAAEKVHHPNVAEIYETGTTKLKDTPLVYAVMEFTEENLEDVLRSRALSADEAKVVAESLVGALAAVHKERLVCGEIEDSSVLAAGDTIKLRSDRLHNNHTSPDTAFQSLAAKDVQALGILLYRCLTQKSPKLDGNDPSIQLLPQPFVGVVRRALSEKATTDEIAALLRGETTPAAPAAAASKPVAASPATAPAPSPAAAASAKTDEKKLPLPVSLSESEPELKPRARVIEKDDEDDDLFKDSSSSRRSPWLVAGILAALVIAGFVLKAMFYPSGGASRPSPAQNAPAAAPTSSPAATQPPAPAPQASAPAPAAPQATPPQPAPETAQAPPPSAPQPETTAAPAEPATPQTPPNRNASWRVVAFTYNHQDQAEHKARTINSQHPDLQAGIFAPRENHPPYLVTLGGWMERDEAFRYLHNAVLKGLPHDTYARNYPQR